MTPLDWAESRYFKAHEAWGDPAKIKPTLVLALNKFREQVGTGILVTCGTQGKHEPRSLHYTGEAADIIIPGIWLRGAWQSAVDSGLFGGVGLYPHWQLDGHVVGGLHLDVRPLVAGRVATWLCVPGPGTSTRYVAASTENFRQWSIT